MALGTTTTFERQIAPAREIFFLLGIAAASSTYL
jgi:hypothetical protein